MADLLDRWKREEADYERIVARLDGAAARRDAREIDVAYRRMSDIQAKPIRWLWPGRIARGKVSMIAGNPGLGKSQLTASLAAIVTTGGRWPVDGGRCDRGSVIFLSAEDDAADTIKPRLMAAGADASRCYMLDAIRETDSDGLPHVRSFSLQKDVDRLGALLETLGEVAMVVIDPISAYLGGTDSHKNSDVRAALAPLSDLAARHGVAVIAVSHLNKGGGNEALMRVTGSLAFVAAARAAYLIAKCKDDPQRRLFLPLKNNLGADEGGLAFTIESCDLDGGIETSRVMWASQPVTMTADEAMRPATDDERTQRDEIGEWLQDLLADGRMKSKEVKAKAMQEGFAWRTVQRAAKAAGVNTREREGFGSDCATYWSLASVAPKNLSRATRASPESVAQLAQLARVDEAATGNACPKCLGEGCPWCA